MTWFTSAFSNRRIVFTYSPCSSSTSCRGKIFRPGSPRPMPYVGVFNMLKRYAKHGDMKKTPVFCCRVVWLKVLGRQKLCFQNGIELNQIGFQKSKLLISVIMSELRWCWKLFGYPSVREPQDVYLTEYSRNSTRLIASKSLVITRSHSPTEATYSCMVSNIFVVPSPFLKQCKDRHVSIQGDIVIQFILPISNRRCL